jgi:hypothetical protein
MTYMVVRDIKTMRREPNMVARACIPSTQPWLYSEFKASLDYMMMRTVKIKYVVVNIYSFQYIFQLNK